MTVTTTERNFHEPISGKGKTFTLCVFCGSSNGTSPEFIQATEELARAMHAQSWSLIYGGGAHGLMGTLATNLVKLSGPTSVHGIIPGAFLKAEAGVVTPLESEYGQTTVVSSMHERKGIMAQEADAYLALPGGYGTMEELFEAISWNQLGIHARPIVIINVGGFFDEMLRWIEKAARNGFVAEGQTTILMEAKTADEAIQVIKNYRPAKGRYLLDWALSKNAI